MIKNLLLLLLTINTVCLFSQKKSDTSFLLKKTWVYKSYQKIFIDNNRTSDFIKELKNATNTEFYQFSDIFNATIDCISKNKVQFNAKRIATKWYPLYLYKGKYYLYSASDPGTSTWIGITDKAIFQLYFEPGIVPAVIEEVHEVNPDQININLFNELEQHYSLNIHWINEAKGLAVFEKINKSNQKIYYLMVSEENVKDYSIVVNYCKEQRVDEFEFEKIDYKKLLNSSIKIK